MLRFVTVVMPGFGNVCVIIRNNWITKTGCWYFRMTVWLMWEHIKTAVQQQSFFAVGVIRAQAVQGVRAVKRSREKVIAAPGQSFYCWFWWLCWVCCDNNWAKTEMVRNENKWPNVRLRSCGGNKRLCGFEKEAAGCGEKKRGKKYNRIEKSWEF